MASPPPPVLAAFGLTGAAVALEGGQGTSWRVGHAVLKPVDLDEHALAWQAEILSAVACDGFRVARPLRSTDGSLVVDGWCAWEAVEGRHEERRWPEIVAAGERFHAALAGVPRPAFIARRTDPWAVADRVAWEELPATRFSHVGQLDRLVAARRPIAAPSQVIHGDLTGNVLFDERLPPAIIDFSPLWRPPPYASAIVVADALVWEGAGDDLLDAVAHVDGFAQYLLRALIFRAVADRLRRPEGTKGPDPYLRAVRLVT